MPTYDDDTKQLPTQTPSNTRKQCPTVQHVQHLQQLYKIQQIIQPNIYEKFTFWDEYLNFS